MSSKTVLITGTSAGGIGYAFVLGFQKRGATVFATARSISKMQDLASLPKVHLLSLDVTSPTSIAAAAKEVDAKTGGKLDVLINNAGVNYIMPGPVRMVQAFQSMLIASQGTIVNIGSGAGSFYLAFSSQYNASKAALNQYSETQRMERASLGVQVVTLVSGNVASNIAKKCSQLPENSLYRPIEKELVKDDAWTEMPVARYADELASEVLAGASGRMYKAFVLVGRLGR
ncbi:NAD(P)-binding protein [Bimuria novae-zelandiae CBS 107.79]|uniref:NAD(P)-binding protein n=1 Tax=Bimuria novae-zelandiae CBS 107.79 TaxID=1447943 RepID=A0A6A5V9S3_9PLEO|nr:NAD(P)-binding protein [Bimuria novae-zelandiae CBS 107.79]